jgi:2-iminobutanoate/2-iminopropanoate deaminase
MCADSITVFRWVEEPIHLSQRGTENESDNADQSIPVVSVGFRDCACHWGFRAAELRPGAESDQFVAGNTLYIAGQEGSDDFGKLAAGGIGPETTAALDNIKKVLKAAGFELNDVVSVTVYLADIHEFPDMNKVYKTVMPDPKPARATIQAAALVNNARIEISAIAVKQK